MEVSIPMLKVELEDGTDGMEFTEDNLAFSAVEFEVMMPDNYADERRNIINANINEIDNRIEALNAKVSELNSEIDRLTNHADGLDYLLAVTCGLVTGIIDSIFVGEWNFKLAKADANREINEKVIGFAKKDPEYANFLSRKRSGNNNPNRLSNAIEYLESKYSLPGDGNYKMFKDKGITDKTHHLDDFCHHPTLIGLVCCVLVQFTGIAKYRSSSGNVEKAIIEINDYGQFVSPEKWGKVFAGVINWFFNVAQTIKNRKGHLMSDIAGSHNSAIKGNEGAGLPGSFLSLAKELSSLPFFEGNFLSENLRKAYQNGIGTKDSQVDLGAFNALFDGASSKFDLRTEMAVGNELKRQAFPVILNEVLVRSIYFIRRLICEFQKCKDYYRVSWKTIMPFNNRTIARMMTIASSTFMAVDLADAAIRSGGNVSAFVLRVNFVGVGRFAIAVATDVGMGVKRSLKESERSRVLCELISLSNSKLFYKKADLMCSYSDLYTSEAQMFNAEASMWIELKLEEQAMQELYQQINETVKLIIQYQNTYCEHYNEIAKIVKQSEIEIEKNNPGLLDEIFRR